MECDSVHKIGRQLVCAIMFKGSESARRSLKVNMSCCPKKDFSNKINGKKQKGPGFEVNLPVL